jgi:hypothetical protein
VWLDLSSRSVFTGCLDGYRDGRNGRYGLRIGLALAGAANADGRWARPRGVESRQILGTWFIPSGSATNTMSPTIEVSEQTLRELHSHQEDGESYDDLVRELIHIYEQQGAFNREGYSE